MKDPEKSLRWIVNILNKHQVPFVITGGFAARIYGSPRPLNDIDIDIPVKYFQTIFEDIEPYIIYGPDHFVDNKWDLQLITLNHEDQAIDLSGGDTIKLFDPKTAQWIEMPTDFINTEEKEIFGIKLPAMALKNLVAYKLVLARESDLEDIQAISKI